jgi:large subunit ribosomal protein L17
MRHHVKKRTLGRKSAQRTALLRSLACSLIRDGKIQTTEAKAKELRPFIEKAVTHAKNDTVAKRRLVLSQLGNKTQTANLFKNIAPKYVDRNGGYTRIVKLPIRQSDASKMALIEFV